MLLLGYDLGSSSIKACLFDVEKGEVTATASSPGTELAIQSPKAGWAEQDPGTWWKHLKIATHKLFQSRTIQKVAIKGIGIAYQMHGLVLVDKNHEVLRPAIIWCDGRAVAIGNKAFTNLGRNFCLEHYLNSPGNFTASKLRWVKEHEPEIYSRIHKAMLPGDYIAMKLSGRIQTSLSGLSEGIFWDYPSGRIATELLDYYGIASDLLPKYENNFAVTGQVNKRAAEELGIPSGIPIGYRAGDQPNNALSLNVLEPGEVAANAGTSGVIYGITDRPLYDVESRVNTFIHVNHDKNHGRYGVLLCINGTGIQNYWLKNELLNSQHSYSAMNSLAAEIPIGSEGICILPFGNGPERVLKNRDIGAQMRNMHFNRHSKAHIMRAAQEGICFSLNYGLNIMKDIGMDVNTIRVGSDNMFQSPVFREAFASTTQTTVEIYNTNGALGAAIGAGMGIKAFKNRDEAFKSLEKIAVLEPQGEKKERYAEAYEHWENMLKNELEK